MSTKKWNTCYKYIYRKRKEKSEYKEGERKRSRSSGWLSAEGKKEEKKEVPFSI